MLGRIRWAGTSQHVASMGPQLYRCGNAAAVEHSNQFRPASMGPQLYRCGNLSSSIRACRSWIASMGPQLYRCGNQKRNRLPEQSLFCFNGAATLSLRKLTMGDIDRTMYALLQWGRNFIVAEMYMKMMDVFAQKVASMGPQLYRCGNSRARHSRYVMGSVLQWGRNFIVAEINHALPLATHLSLASMGPQLYRCGNTNSDNKGIRAN